jgi:hypothetical protein
MNPGLQVPPSRPISTRSFSQRASLNICILSSCCCYASGRRYGLAVSMSPRACPVCVRAQRGRGGASSRLIKLLDSHLIHTIVYNCIYAHIPPCKIDTRCIYLYAASCREGCVLIGTLPCETHTVQVRRIVQEGVPIKSYGGGLESHRLGSRPACLPVATLSDTPFHPWIATVTQE